MADYGTDLLVSYSLRGSSTVDLAGEGARSAYDLATVSARDNLAQAIRMRLATARGELAHLGHARYGSRLHLLIGRLDLPETRALAAAYVREALRLEPRIERIVTLVVEGSEQPGGLRIDLIVQPTDDEEPLAVAIDLALDGQTGA